MGFVPSSANDAVSAPTNSNLEMGLKAQKPDKNSATSLLLGMGFWFPLTLAPTLDLSFPPYYPHIYVFTIF